MKIDVSRAMTIKLSDELPPKPEFESQYRRAPDRGLTLSEPEVV